MTTPGTPSTDDIQARAFGRLLWLLSLSAIFVSGGIHYQSPMLAAMAADLGATSTQIAWVPTLSFAGMFAGVLLLVPLGDRMNRRRLALGKLALLCASQAAMAAAPTVELLAAASFATGLAGSLVQSMIAIVAAGAKPAERGRAMGTLFTGLFLGILFARIVGGAMASEFGWRSSYVLSTALLLGVFALFYARLPGSTPTTTASYAALLRSAFDLLRTHADIRRAAAIQFMLGTCYGAFWAVLAPMMSTAHRLTAAQIGLIGIPGAAGILVARPAGRWMDRSGILPVGGTAIAAMITAWLLLGFGEWYVAAVIVGAVLLDCALRASLVSNQTLVNTAAPEARARANTIFGSHVWGGNATGAFLGGHAYALMGWPGVCGVCLLACVFALAIHMRVRRSHRNRAAS